MHFLDPTNDYAFRRIFGNEKKPNILISFLNSILHLRGERVIQQVSLANPSQVPHIKDIKETVLDVRCQDESGAEYIVEMQVLNQKYFDKRVLYYASKTYANQLDSGTQYTELVPVTFLGILNFNFTENSHYISTHTIHDVETKEHILTDFRFTFAELSKFKKAAHELVAVEDKWLYFLKHATELNAIPEIIQEQAIKDAFRIANQANWTKRELEVYDKRNMMIEDEIQRIRYGEEQGEKKGRKEGREEGRKQRNIEVAKNLLTEGHDLALIAKVTELSIAEIEKIKLDDPV